MIVFDEPDMYYEYNTLCFWATSDGRVYTASDYGCSYPTPFEDYEGCTQEEVIQKLEQVGSAKQAEKIFDGWNTCYDKSKKLSISHKQELLNWVKIKKNCKN